MFRIFKTLFCKHKFEFVRNLYGDQIIEWGYKRSIHKCAKCGKIKAFDKLGAFGER